MNEQELREENERLRRELAEVTKSRERLREIVCAITPVDPSDVMESMVQEMMQRPVHGIDDIIEDLRRDQPGASKTGKQIPA